MDVGFLRNSDVQCPITPSPIQVNFGESLCQRMSRPKQSLTDDSKWPRDDVDL